MLYLTGNQNIGLLDFLQNEHGQPLKRLAGEFHLYRFVTRDMRSFAHITRLVIDLSSIRDTEKEIIDALSAFRTMYDARIIILADGRKPGDAFLSTLFDEGIRNFITSESIEGMRLEILDCLSDGGMRYEDALRFRIKEVTEGQAEAVPMLSGNYRFTCNGLKVMVAGSTSKTGTTTVALNLAHFLANLGAATAYLEANEHGHILTLPIMHKGIQEANGGIYEYKGVRYYPARQKYRFGDYQFNIIDIGVLKPELMELYRQADCRILCAPGKPYGLQDLLGVLNLLGESTANVLVHSTPDNSREEFRRIVSSQNRQAFFPGYSPDLFDGSANAAIWSQVMAEYVVATQNVTGKLDIQDKRDNRNNRNNRNKSDNQDKRDVRDKRNKPEQKLRRNPIASWRNPS